MLVFFITLFTLIIIGVLFMQQKAFGQNPTGERLKRISNSPNFKDGKFHNLADIPVMAEDAGFFKMTKLFFTKHPNTEPSKPLPVKKVNLKTLSPDSATIVWFGHSSYLIFADHKKILVDPVFSKRASPVSFAGVTSFKGTDVFSPSDMLDIDILIITHDHYDHLDYRTIMQLQSRTTCFVVPLGVGQHLESWGVEPSKIIEFDWWDEKKLLPGFSIACTPSQHFSGREFVRNKSLWASFVLMTPNTKLFIGGDSGYGEHFKQIGEKYGPFDMVMLESGQYNTLWRYIHMMPEQTAQAAIDLKTKVLLPVHWGKFKLSVHPWTEPIKRVSKKAAELGLHITTPMIGEPISIQNPPAETNWYEVY